jgi:hypothetical protein
MMQDNGMFGGHLCSRRRLQELSIVPDGATGHAMLPDGSGNLERFIRL